MENVARQNFNIFPREGDMKTEVSAGAGQLDRPIRATSGPENL